MPPLASPSDGAGGRARITLVGPDPRTPRRGHAGGQLTAAAGIVAFASGRGIHLEVVDTFVDSLARPSFGDRVIAGLRRLAVCIRQAAMRRTDGLILFVGARASFFERVAIAGVSRILGVQCAFCIRDGAFPGWAGSSRVLRLVVMRLLRIPRTIVVQGWQTAALLQSMGAPADRFRVVRNWLPAGHNIAAEPRRVANGEAVRFIYMGWLVREKGLRELMAACRILARDHALRVDIVGGGPLEEELKAEAVAAGVKAEFWGWLPAAGVAERLAEAHVLVLPSYFEGFPNALLESMAAGLGSVCTDVGAVAESVSDGCNGFIVAPADETALAGAMERYLREPALVEAHGSAAQAVVKELHGREGNLSLLFGSVLPGFDQPSSQISKD